MPTSGPSTPPPPSTPPREGWVGPTAGSRLVTAVRSARPVAGRWPAAVVALLGVALSVPSVTGPTWLQTIADRERGELLSRQWQWSWGRVDLTGLTGVELDLVPNPVGLVVAVVLLVLGAAAVVVWMLARGGSAVLAPVAVALLAGRLLTTSAERHGRSFREVDRSEAGLTVTIGSTTAGWLETVAAVVLLAALALMLLRLQRGPAVVVGEDDGRHDDDPGTRHTATVPARAALRPKGARLTGPDVGLSDEEAAMTTVARWREMQDRMPFVSGRLPAAVPAVLGGLLAAATIIWPVMRMTQYGTPGDQRVEFAQLTWSWGRYSLEGVPVDQEQPFNVAPVYVLGLACLAGVLGGLAWLLRRGSDGRVLGGAGVAFALAFVGGSVVQRLGNLSLYDAVESSGFRIETLPAGRVEFVAAVLLLLALLLMLWRPLVWLARSLWAFAARGWERARERASTGEDPERAEAGEPVHQPRVGTAVLRDTGSVSGTSRAPDRAARGREGTSEGVGFSDGASPEDRFRPPT